MQYCNSKDVCNPKFDIVFSCFVCCLYIIRYAVTLYFTLILIGSFHSFDTTDSVVVSIIECSIILLIFMCCIDIHLYRSIVSRKQK